MYVNPIYLYATIMHRDS